VRCWGFGKFGRLGYGNVDTIGNNETPASVGDIELGGAAIQIAAGGAHTCALLDAGAVRCWGSSRAGQLGLGERSGFIGDDETPAGAGDVPLF
jgi:alpha-tubulin suppressor-like RCC1 family protein